MATYKEAAHSKMNKFLIVKGFSGLSSISNHSWKEGVQMQNL
jgi:hypothetical protein